MDAERLEKLTEKQRECLRMVLKHYSSKEMAREFGIGVDAVDQRLKSAMRKLGVSSRFEAARMLASYEGNSPRSEPLEKEPGHASLPVNRRRGRLFPIRSFFGRAKKILPRTRRGRFVFWACLGSLLFGFLGAGLPIDNYFRDRNVMANLRPASGNIVLVLIDEKSVKALGRTPWPRRHYAEVFRQLDRLGASTIVVAPVFDKRSDPVEDQELANVLQGLRARLVLSPGAKVDPQSGETIWSLPLPEFRRRAVIAQSVFSIIFSTPRSVQYKVKLDRTFGSTTLELANAYPPLSPWWAWMLGWRADRFLIDYAVDPRSIPTVSAADLIAGKVSPALVKGNNVLLVVSHARAQNPIPGNRRVSDGHVLAIAAETLIRGPPADVPWTIPFAAVLLIVVACSRADSAAISITLLGGSLIGMLLLPSVLFPHRTYIDVSPTLFLLMLVGVRFSWAFARSPWLPVAQ